MGILIGLERVSHAWPSKPVLHDQTIGIYEGDRIGIVGRNGEGKSSLLAILARHIQPDAGSVTWRSGIAVGVLEQDDSFIDEGQVLPQVVGDVPEYEWAGNAQKRQIIDGLLSDVDLSTTVASLSGGQRRRADLARLLLGDWDVLVLDEPTNHLDLVGITWLANHLNTRWSEGQGALLVVTHDRWFLDTVCQALWEVHNQGIEAFEGGYSAYIHKRVERERLASVREERRQNTLRRELAWLSRGAQARTSKARFRIKEAEALVTDVPPLRQSIELKQLSLKRLGKQVVEFQDVSLKRGGTKVIDHLDWIIGPGDRIGILGANGTGKTTLLSLISGILAPTSGRITIGKSVHFGMLTQRLDEIADKQDWTVQDLISYGRRRVISERKEYSVEQLVEMLGFDRSELTCPLKDLSGGQKRRLTLLMLLIEEPNVLLLDEPGNDLDTDMLAAMEDMLDAWAGTLILVTHDRYLMERVVDNEYALIDGSLRHLPGGIDEYLKLEAERLSGKDRTSVKNTHDQVNREIKATRTATRAEITGIPTGTEMAAQPPLSNQERYELKKRFNALERKLPKLQDTATKLRVALQDLPPSDYQALMEAQDQLNKVLVEIDALESEWLELADILENA